MLPYTAESLTIAEVITNRNIPRCVLISVRMFGFIVPEPVPGSFFIEDFEVMETLAAAYEKAATIIDSDGTDFQENITIVVDTRARTIGICVDMMPQLNLNGSLWMDEPGFPRGHGAYARAIAKTLRVMSEHAHFIVYAEESHLIPA